jgi:SAM-dependent methyltransferase
MNEDQRSQVRDSARYLQQVRPVDPGEIHEYVEGKPHPAAVRRVLREEAPDLGLLEREDGRFEPVPDGTLDVAFDGIQSLPPDIERALEDLLVEQFGPDWPDGESGARLRSTVRDFKQRYLQGATVTYDEETALGYAIYHLPPYFAAIQYVLAGLAAETLLPRQLRVLDVGAGVGGPALGLDEFVGPEALVEYHAVEPSPAAAAVLSDLLAETGRNVHTTVHRDRVERFDPPVESFDLVVFSNVLSELDDPAGQVERAMGWLDPDGSVVALAPADRNTAIGLREVERSVEERTGATVYAPTVRLWPHERPAGTSWSFTRRQRLAAPAVQRRLDEGDRNPEEPAGPASVAGGGSEPQGDPDADRGYGQTDGDGEPVRLPGDGEFVNVDVQYAYSVLRQDGKQAIAFRPDQGRVAKLAASERNVTERIDCVAIKLSPDLSEGGNPLFLVGDGSQQVDHFAVLTEPSSLNRDLLDAGYGELLSIENTLVLWNDDEGAYNLVVDRGTIVERVPA